MIFLATWCVLDVMFGNKEEEQNIPCDGPAYIEFVHFKFL